MKRCTPEEYLAIERRVEYKNEYLDGEIQPVDRANQAHCLIAVNLVGELGLQLKGRPGEVYPGAMRVKVTPTGLYTYPDVTVICDEPQFDDKQHDTLLNLTLLIEVLSKTTEDYDRGRKFEHYRQLASLHEYLLVAQEKHHVERYRRQSDGQWLLWETNRPDDTVVLQSIDCELAMAEIYDKVEIPPTPAEE